MAFHAEPPQSFEEALSAARNLLGASRELAERGSIEAEAELIVAAAYRKGQQGGDLRIPLMSRMELFARSRDRFPEPAGRLVQIWAQARAQGRLLQHLTGTQHFLDHEYEVSAEVLVPRPETEVLAQVALERLRAVSPSVGLEIGLGSGILSIELLAAIPGLRMVATELSEAAASCARRNAERILGATHARLQVARAEDASEIWQPFERAGVEERSASFLISNPPYLLAAEAEPEVSLHEPAHALFAPEGDPLYFYREIAHGARRFLRLGGAVFLEIPHERAGEIAALFSGLGFELSGERDLNGRPRVLIARLTT